MDVDAILFNDESVCHCLRVVFSLFELVDIYTQYRRRG